MEAVRTPILEGITLEEQEQMRVCFGVREERFRAGETVYDFAEGRKYLGLIARGSAVIQRIDRQHFFVCGFRQRSMNQARGVL